MAIKFDIDAHKVLDQLGISTEMCNWFKDSKYGLKLSTDKLSIYHPSLDETLDVVFKKCPGDITGKDVYKWSKWASISDVGKAHLPVAAKACIKNKLEKFIGSIMETEDLLEMSPPIQSENSDNSANVLGGSFLSESISQKLEKVGSGGLVSKPAIKTPDATYMDLPKKAPMEFTHEFPGELLHDEPVALKSATKLYQPVSGTTGGSVYYVVAGNDQVKVAAKFSYGTLSVRVSSWTFASSKHLQTKLSKAGFKIMDSYASIHLSCGNLTRAKKALGAVLMSIELNFDTLHPNLAFIPGFEGVMQTCSMD